jgi:hypothetical protein
MTEALFWSELWANGATILAALIAAITIPLAYYQLRKTEEARRLDIVETRILMLFLRFPMIRWFFQAFPEASTGSLASSSGGGGGWRDCWCIGVTSQVAIGLIPSFTRSG